MSLVQRAAQGAIWSFVMVLLERVLGFTFLALLLRLVPARDIGLIAITSAISELTRMVTVSGVGEQVQATPGNKEVEAGAFWSQLCVAAPAMLLLWGGAPSLARLFHLPHLALTLQAMALSLVMTCFLIVPSARLMSRFRFRQIGFISIGSTVLGGCCALPLAFYGHGLAALVVQRLVGVGFYAIVASLYAKWTPPPPPKLSVLYAGLRFSFPLMQATFVDFIANSGYIVLLGLLWPVTLLAQFRIAQRLMDILQDVAYLPTRKILLPVLVTARETPARQTLLLQRLLDPFCLLVSLASTVAGAGAVPLVLLLFGPGWRQAGVLFSILALAVPYLALYGLINPILTAQGQLKKVSLYAWFNAFSIILTCALAAPLGARTLALALALRSLLGLILFGAGLRHGAKETAWPVLQFLWLPLSGMVAGRLIALALTHFSGHLGTFPNCLLLCASSGLVFCTTVYIIAPQRLNRMIRAIYKAVRAEQIAD